ncbi:hypothetical protein BDA99DRAFT_510101 [Phascolomyces articulosus]|uniref:F-box domain-containing protein n=1 Tax=Phascolomyces articulosus TaxID=60185 RepID=A0AAD5KAV9_9FUNG|nr:hypothetical protein BDA99DRAFT_510101 [Phascolomyces articulosus]
MTNIDFIKILPYHILNFIFEKCPLRDLIRYTRVSKTWRSFLLSWPGLFHDLSDRLLNIPRDLIHYEPYFDGNYVRTVHILGRSKEEQEHILSFLIQHDCSLIEYIRIICDTTKITQLGHLFKTTGSSLKRLHVYSSGTHCILPMILNSCTNLKELHFSHSAESFRTLSSKDLQLENIRPTSTIQQLSLDILIPLPLLKNTLRLFPYLKRIDLNALAVEDVGGLILKCLHTVCSNLEHVQVDGEHTTLATTVTRIKIAKKEEAEEEEEKNLTIGGGGWRVLILGQISGLNDTQVAPLLQKRGKTLEAIHIVACEDLGDATFSTLAMIGCPNLQYLCLRLNYFMYEEAKSANYWPIHFQPKDLCKIIRQAPLLEEVNFSYLDNITDGVLDALADLKNLMELEIGYCENVTTKGLCRFIYQQHNVNENNNDNGDHSTIAAQGASMNQQGQRARQELKSLHLLGMKGVTDQVLYAIAQSKDTQALKSLDLGNNEQITETGLKTLVDRFSKTNTLKWLGINHCTKIHSNAYEYACQHLNNTNIYRTNMKLGYNISLSR